MMENLKGYKLEYKQGTKWNQKGYSWYLECRECTEMTRISDQHIDSVLCSTCVARSINNLDNDND